MARRMRIGLSAETNANLFESGLETQLRSARRQRCDPPRANGAPYDKFVSAPAKPVPFRVRPIQSVDYTKPATWSEWLVDDQRNASSRPDVISFISDRLTASVKISGPPIVHLNASTSGTDSDWVVKVIDVYPD